jgi:uncharacterized membrane protein HdeD (DUF308 family)
MSTKSNVVFYVLALIVIVVGVVVLFLQHHTVERLTVNVGIVLAFGAFYLVVVRRR